MSKCKFRYREKSELISTIGVKDKAKKGAEENK